VYGAFKYTCSILHLLIFLGSEVFWVFWNLFVSACSAILLGDVIAKKTKIHEVFRPPLIDVRGNTVLTGIEISYRTL